MIAGVNKRVSRVILKYGVELPTSVSHAKRLDEMHGNTRCMDAINREMENLTVAFDILDDGSQIQVDHNKSSGYLEFDFRMTLERKSRWFKDGHKTPKPELSTFAGVISRESTRIILTHAALNDVSICACDIQNTYFQVPSSENTMLFVV